MKYVGNKRPHTAPIHKIFYFDILGIRKNEINWENKCHQKEHGSYCWGVGNNWILRILQNTYTTRKILHKEIMLQNDKDEWILLVEKYEISAWRHRRLSWHMKRDFFSVIN